MARPRKEKPDLSALETEYREIEGLSHLFCDEITKQIGRLLDDAGVALGFPIQRRVKRWESIANKFDRLSLPIKRVLDLQDLVGLRLILLFQRDINKVCEIISSNFKVERRYDTQERLKADQFGYSSIHFVALLRDEWLAVPTLAKMGNLRAEIQVRTVAQHIWAEASHSLQYKQEESVPSAMLRGIYRVSALLETVDLEFERVLEQRDRYRAEINEADEEGVLNVDVLEKILNDMLPPANKKGDEDYAALLTELIQFDVRTAKDIRRIIRDHLDKVRADDQRKVVGLRERRAKGLGIADATIDRIDKGVYYTHEGLVRLAMDFEYGEAWTNYLAEKYASEEADGDSG
jgi:putative GTP pyrophosphokinase